jgi:hypothetical protein
MRQGSNSEALALWDGLFPGKIPQDLVLADPLPDHTIELEGHDLVAVQLGRTDTDETTCLHVPEIGPVVAGDTVCNDVHQYLRESLRPARVARRLDTIESLGYRAYG